MNQAGQPWADPYLELLLPHSIAVSSSNIGLPLLTLQLSLQLPHTIMSICLPLPLHHQLCLPESVSLPAGNDHELRASFTRLSSESPLCPLKDYIYGRNLFS